MFILMGSIMLLVALWDVASSTLSIPLALIGLVVGAAAGFFSSRLFHLSWDHDGKRVVGRINTIGWIVLALYIAFEIARSSLFEAVLHVGASATAITFVFVASALIARVLGLRGKIVRILRSERVFE